MFEGLKNMENERIAGYQLNEPEGADDEACPPPFRPEAGGFRGTEGALTPRFFSRNMPPRRRRTVAIISI